MKNKSKLKKILLLRDFLLIFAVVLAVAAAAVGTLWFLQGSEPSQETVDPTESTSATTPGETTMPTQAMETTQPVQTTEATEATESEETTQSTEATGSEEATESWETTVPTSTEATNDDALKALLDHILEAEDPYAVAAEIEAYAQQNIPLNAPGWQEDVRQRSGVWFDSLTERYDGAQTKALSNWDKVRDAYGETVHENKTANELVEVLEEFFSGKRPPEWMEDKG